MVGPSRGSCIIAQDTPDNYVDGRRRELLQKTHTRLDIRRVLIATQPPGLFTDLAVFQEARRVADELLIETAHDVVAGLDQVHGNLVRQVKQKKGHAAMSPVGTTTNQPRWGEQDSPTT